MAALKFESKELKLAAIADAEKKVAASRKKHDKASMAYEKAKAEQFDLENELWRIKAARVSKPKA